MEHIDISDLVQRLASDEDSVRKMAVFKLQSVIGDPSFADVFIYEGGLPRLRSLCLHATGNTLAYSLTSLARLLELDKGWEVVNGEVIERVVELVVTHPLVNILRGAMSILVAIVSHPHTTRSRTSSAQSGTPPATSTSIPGPYGFRALKPAIAIHPTFLEMLVSRLSSADHALCANALQLINSLMRDAITADPPPSTFSPTSPSSADATGQSSTTSGAEWPKFIKRLQDLGVIKAVYNLMQSTGVGDLAGPILEFQGLTKVLLRKWREVRVDSERPEHRRALKGLWLAANGEGRGEGLNREPSRGRLGREGSRRGRQDQATGEKWRRLGFESESPAWEFEDTGFLGMMDLTDFVRKHEERFQKLLLEQQSQPAEKRCPIARASLAVTAILYEHFEVDKGDDGNRYVGLESRNNFDKIFRPLLLQWSRLHTAGLNAFFRLWKATGAEAEDFGKVEELVGILVEQVVGQAPRTKDVVDVEEELQDFEYKRLRELQMELLELTYEDAWGHHLRQVRDELNHEALQFVKEQRIRCLLSGAWFPNAPPYKAEEGPVTQQNLNRIIPTSWKYVRLSHNRRYLHYADFNQKSAQEPSLDLLPEKIDLSIVSSVVSNVSASAPSTSSSTSTVKHPTAESAATTNMKITIHGYLPSSTKPPTSHSPSRHQHNTSSSTYATHRPTESTSTHLKHSHAHAHSHSTAQQKETPLLHLHPQSHTLASEWLDGLLMLLNQQPITADTNKLVQLISLYGLKIRLLNVRFVHEEGGGFGGEHGGGGAGAGGMGIGIGLGGLKEGEVGVVPGREGVDEEYFYDIGGL